MTAIQIVEDDTVLSNGIVMTLGGQDIRFIQSGTVMQAEKDFSLHEPDAVILDLNLPDGNGYDYLKWLRGRSKVPVLILTADDLEINEVMGLEMGADDFVTKPFSLAVLRARMHALLRRGGGEAESSMRGREIVTGPFRFNFETSEYERDGKKIFLSSTEQKLLRLLVGSRNRLLTRDLLFDRIWGNAGCFVEENALSVAVNRLRSKLGDGEDGVSYIRTVYGQGYMWKDGGV